jgi:hypothetical protein
MSTKEAVLSMKDQKRRCAIVGMAMVGWVGCGGDDGGTGGGEGEPDLSVVTAAEMSSMVLQFTCDYTGDIHLEGSVDFEFLGDSEAPLFYFSGTGTFAGSGHDNLHDVTVLETAYALSCTVSMQPPEGTYQDYSRLVVDITCDQTPGTLGDRVYLFGSNGDPVSAQIDDVSCDLLSGTGSYTLTAPAAEFAIVNASGP